MKAKIIRTDCTGPNPTFNKKKPVSATNNPEVSVPLGTIIDHFDCHYLCYGDEPNAEPADAECQAKFDAWLKAKEEGLAAREAAAAGVDDEPEAPAPEVKKPTVRTRPPVQPATD